jgi:heme-degrading monooxygenase HmoA
VLLKLQGGELYKYQEEKEETKVWVRLTFGKVISGKADELRKIYYEELVPVIKAQKGNVDIFLLESVETEGDMISYNAWESKEDGDAYESSGTYQEMLDKVKHTFAEPTTLKSYKVKKL